MKLELFTYIGMCFAILFGLGNFIRAEREKEVRKSLEDESKSFHEILLDHLADWKVMQVERDQAFHERDILQVGLRLIASTPSYPEGHGVAEIPGYHCQVARTYLQKVNG